MMSKLHDAIVADRGREVLGPTLQELAKYTQEHFAEEERLMDAIHYPQLAAHRKKHEGLTRQVQELQAKFRDGKIVFSMTVSSFLAEWLKHHIKEDDVALVEYMKTHPTQQGLTATTRG